MNRLSRASAIWWVGLVVAALFVGGMQPAVAVSTPPAPTGTTCGAVGTSYMYYGAAPGGYDWVHPLYMRFLWGDGTSSDYAEVTSFLKLLFGWHPWSAAGTYSVRSQAKEETSPGVFEESAQSSPLNVIAGVAPSAPASLAASSGSGGITLTWTSPTDTGGAPVTNYILYRYWGNTIPIDPLPYGTVGNVLTYTDTAVTAGDLYHYSVAAGTCAGEGPRTDWLGVRAGLPGAPVLNFAIPGAKQISLAWAAPADTGSSAITNYEVLRGNAPGTEVPLATTGNVLTYVDTGLADGMTYCYQVAARNDAGAGPASNELCATTGVLPGAPTLTGLTEADGRVLLAWTAPSSEGGIPITNYRIYRGTAPLLEVFLVEVGNVLTYIDTGLTNGQQYCYNVSAKNGIGEGPRSTELCGVPKALPGVPRNLAAVPANTQVTLTWEAPASDGGSAITNYRIYRRTVGGGMALLIEVGAIFTFTDTGLINGQAYIYQVSARNAVGEGPKTPEASGTPAAAPTAPTGLAAVGGDAQVTLTWLAPANDGGVAITNYRIYRGTASGALSFLVEVGNVLTYADTGLTTGVTYYFQVSAVNAAGEGTRSAEVSAGPEDLVAPTVAITSPAHLSTLSTTTVTVTGTASDNAGIQKVELSTDGTTWLAATGGTAWSGTLTLVEGENTIYARATDTSGNTGTSTIRVTVQLGSNTQDLGLPGWVLPAAIVAVAAVVAVGAFLWWRSRKPGV